MLSLLTGADMTAADVARELDLTHANASYHLRLLQSAGKVEVTGEEKIRGGVAKRYRYVTEKRDYRKDNAGRPLTDDQRLVFEAFGGEFRRRSEQYVAAEHNLLADAEFWVEPQVWAEIHERIAAAVADLHEAARPPRTPGTVHTSTTVAMFHMKQR